VAFRIGVVVRNIWSAVSLGEAQVGQKGDWLGSHDPAAVRMDVELAGGDLVFANGLLDELLGQFGGFPMGDHPAGDVAAEDVEDDIEIEVGPLGRTQQFGDVPRRTAVQRKGPGGGSRPHKSLR